MLLWILIGIGLIIFWMWLEDVHLCPSCGSQLPKTILGPADYCTACGWRKRY